MDNDELRNMYANLLANSMNKVVKDGVHPGFVEIIKQLCPDEAKILRELNKKRMIPTVSVRYEDSESGGIKIVSNFSDIGELAKCDMPYDTQNYFDNLERLGLIETEYGSSFSNKTVYDSLKAHPHIVKYMDIPPDIHTYGYEKVRIEESFFRITGYGRVFCSICICD